MSNLDQTLPAKPNPSPNLHLNPYDQSASSWATTKTSGRHYSHDLLEKPFMQSRLPDLTGKKVLALGCGSGEECQMLIKAGATSVLGIDSSKALIEQAKYSIGLEYPQCSFLVQDLSKLNLDDGDFDFVYSSLTLHYLADWPGFLQNLSKLIKPTAKFLFSTHHPVKWGARTDKTPTYNQFLLGYKKNKLKESDFEVYGDYLGFYELEASLMQGLKIKCYHRSIQKIFEDIGAGGWQIRGLWEPKPVENAKTIKPDFYEVHCKIPMFLVVELSLKPT